MKIAIATSDFSKVSGHAGQARRGVLAGELLPDPRWNPGIMPCKLRDLASRY